MANEGIEIDLNTIPDDPAEALKLLEAIERGEQPQAAPAQAPAQAAAPAADPAPAAPVEDKSKAASEPVKDPQQPTSMGEEDPAGIATKDGKHVIPYAVLQTERERSRAATDALREMTDRVTALEQALKAAANGANTGAAARAADAATAEASTTMSDADLEALKEDFPTVYKALMTSQQTVTRLEAALRQQEGFRQEVEAASQRSVEETVQDAIDANPKLAFIQTNDPTAFTLAQQFDDTLKNSAAWANKPMSERFAKVIEMVESANGAISLPGSKPTPPEPAANAEDLKAKAQAAAAAAAKTAKADVPTSLSEFPVGEPPAQDQKQTLENMSQTDLAAMLLKMSPAQQEAYFASLA
ncbi:hypothetical protein [Burkholderia sp. Bp8990]|uniref:hypothetical protein n=1 Tax=Burkholderia sp. Bp8990 TaxID=2184552 RepID=UPI000F5B5A7F|nr:hypothetical protein [Burkholderia sp. Bp8990]RQS39770.1 hypothetical protein DIE01_16295 [Burkholderia sp. Bp8990]